MINPKWIPDPTILTGKLIDLVPLEKAHLPELCKIATDPKIWEFYLGNWAVESRFIEVYHAVLEKKEKNEEYPFIIYHKPSARIIGSTRLMDMSKQDNRLEIGGTWLQVKYWATAINFDCKLALLKFCFENLAVNRVQLKTQHDNIRSRKAIEKIGGIYEGVIRQHILKEDGSYRSSAYFSILKEEWPIVKTKLELLLRNKMEI
ncbi:MAG: GNAT family N-acetyltransferase [Saprospiraceae bacterium]|nr:GNAT family N-acetyltransferase [Saprospiraceae bacterium]